MVTRRSFLVSLPLTTAAWSTQKSLAAPTSDYAVVIGDSIAEGEPNRHGRLNVNGQFVPGHPSLPGQLSYELATYSHVFHFNHGIGGQVSSQVRQRWQRDVLAQDFDPGDGRGPRTLPFSSLPKLIYLHVGINDIATKVPQDELRDNFSFFALSAAKHKLPLIIDNIGAWQGMPDPLVNEARAFNTWLATKLVPRYNNIELIDYLYWSSGGSGDYRSTAPGKFVDGLHPTLEGYQDLARYVHETVRMPAGSPIRY